MRRLVCIIVVAIVVAGLPGVPGSRAEPQTTLAPSVAVADLLSRDLAAVPGREVRILTVEYVAGGASLPHRHHAQVFVYVLEGQVRMQVAGSPEVTLGPGGIFYEGPADIHSVAANASATQAAKILVFMVRDKTSPISIPVASAGGNS